MRVVIAAFLALEGTTRSASAFLSSRAAGSFAMTAVRQMTESSISEGETEMIAAGPDGDDSSTSDSADVFDIADVGAADEASTTAAASSSEESALLINDLLRIASSSERGQFASDDEKESAAATIASLETMNPTPRPTEAFDTIEGTWDLLYSSTQLFRSSPFFMAGRAVCETDDQAKQYDWFCDMHRAALAISTIGKVRQIISSDRIVSEFEVKVGSVPFLSDFTPFAYSGGLPFTIDGAIVSSADITSVDAGMAWEIFMDTVEIKGSNIPLLRQILDAGLKLRSRDLGSFLEDNVSGYTNPRPVFETTYLDDSIRISRDQDGKVFVYGKVSDGTNPTDYGGIDSDLGVLKLLEGFNDSILKFYI